MTVTPLDMRQATFATAMRGFDKAEVTRFLTRPPTATSRRCARTSGCGRRSPGSKAPLAQYRELEGSLRTR